MRSWIHNLQPREKRAVAALLFAAPLFLFLYFIVFPVLDSADAVRADLPVKEKALRKYRAMVALVPSAETDWKAVQDRIAQSEKAMLENHVPALATVEIQELIKQMFRQQGMEAPLIGFARPQVLPANPEYSTIGVTLNFVCGVDQLSNLMQSLRDSPKMLVVDQFGVDAQSRGEKQPKVLSVRLTLHGLMFSDVQPKS